MAAGSSVSFGKIAKIQTYNPSKVTVASLRKRVDPAFRPPWDRVLVTNAIESCCFSSHAMTDYIEEYHPFLTNADWAWKLGSSTRLDMNRAWIRLTDFEFWDVEASDNIGRTYIFRFEDCLFGQQQSIEFGNPAEILREGKKFRDGDLCYCFREEADCLLVTELFFVDTFHGKSGFVKYGTHKWVLSNSQKWRSTISNLVGVHYFQEQAGSKKVYKK